MKYKGKFSLISSVLSIFIIIFICSSLQYAISENRNFLYSKKLDPGDELNPKVQFWKLILARYGKDQTVFHHVDHPEIIYSVLDYSKLRKVLTKKALSRKRGKNGEKEKNRISETLAKLSEGASPSNNFEKRLVKIFKPFGGKKAMKEASDVKKIRSQRGIRERFSGGIQRSSRYLPHIEKIFKSKGIPLEITRLPLVESSFDVSAKSKVAAVGIWQFMRSTGRRFMTVNRLVDERRDPIIASRAAASYLKNAYSRLKSWPVAITSYNHGIAGMVRAIKDTGSRNISKILNSYKGKSFGFASKNFFVSFIAAFELHKERKKFFPKIPMDPLFEFDEVRIAKPELYSKIRKLSKMSSEKFRSYNPAFLSSVRSGIHSIPPRSIIKVEKGKGRKLIDTLGRGQLLSITGEIIYAVGKMPTAAEVKRSLRPLTYRIRKGDTLASIARKFGISISSIKRLNKIRNANRIRVGKKLKLPGGIRTYRRSKATSMKKRSSVKPQYYRVKSGDSLAKIAAKKGSSVKKLRSLNPGIKTTIYPGQKLRIQ